MTLPHVIGPLAWTLRGAVFLAGMLLLAFTLRRGSAVRLTWLWRASMVGALLLVADALGRRLPPQQESAEEKIPPISPKIVPARSVYETAALVTESTPVPASSPVAPVTRVAATVPPVATPPPTPAGAAHSIGTPPLGQVIWAVWAAGALWVIGRWLLALWRRRRLAANAVPVTEADDWQRILAGFSAGKRSVRLLRHPTASIPCAWGVWRPTILLPAAADAWTDEKKRLVLAHEAAHLRHGDPFWQTVAVLVRALHWPNPFVWLAARRWRLTEENAADDAAVADAEPATYAALLLECSRSANRSTRLVESAFSMAHPSTVALRIERVLDPSQKRKRPSAGGTVAAASAVVAGAFLCALATPSLTAREEREQRSLITEWSRHPDADVRGLALVDRLYNTLPSDRSYTGKKLAPVAAAAAPAAADTPEAKLEKIVFQSIQFADASFDNAMQVLERQSKILDDATLPEKQRGVQFLLKLGEFRPPNVTLDRKQATLGDVLRELCKQAGVSATSEGDHIVIQPMAKTVSRQSTGEKLRDIVLSLQLQDATLEEAVEYLRIKSKELDKDSPSGKRGVSFVLKLGKTKPPPVTLTLTNVPLGVVLKSICDVTGYTFFAEPFSVLIQERGTDTELYTKVYRVRPELVRLGGRTLQPDGTPAPKQDLMELLESRGISLKKQGGSALLDPADCSITVRANKTTLELIESFISQRSESGMPAIAVRAELYRIPKSELLSILDRFEGKEDVTPLFEEIRKRASTGSGVALLAAPALVTRSGSAAAVQAGEVPTADAKGPNAGDAAKKPASPTAPLTVNDPNATASRHGAGLMVDPVLGPDGWTMDVSARVSYGTGNAARAISAATGLISGKPRLLGALETDNPDESILVFIKAVVGEK